MYHQFKQGQSIILLLSGGMDSIGLWLYLLKKYHLHVYPLHIYSSHLNTPQYRSIKHYESQFQHGYPTYFHPVLFYHVEKPLFTFSLLKRNYQRSIPIDILINNLSYDSSTKKHAPLVSDWPLRISKISSIGVEYAMLLMSKGIKDIYTILFGIMPEDHQLADSQLSYLELLSQSINSALRSNRWRVRAPIDKKNKFYISKKELTTFTNKEKISLSQTWSCNSSLSMHCGICFNCLTRKQAFQKAKIEDTTHYTRSKQKPPLTLRLLQEVQRWLRKMTVVKTRSLNYYPRQKYLLNPKVDWIEKDEEVHIFNKQKGHIDRLEGTGRYIWSELANSPRSSVELTQKICSHYEITSTSAAKDVKKFLIILLQQNYLTTSDE